MEESRRGCGPAARALLTADPQKAPLQPPILAPLTRCDLMTLNNTTRYRKANSTTVITFYSFQNSRIVVGKEQDVVHPEVLFIGIHILLHDPVSHRHKAEPSAYIATQLMSPIPTPQRTSSCPSQRPSLGAGSRSEEVVPQCSLDAADEVLCPCVPTSSLKGRTCI